MAFFNRSQAFQLGKSGLSVKEIEGLPASIEPKPFSSGNGLLANFLRRNGLKQTDAATALGVSAPTLSDWLSKMKRPRAHHRRAIAIWTRNGVPESAWDTAQEQQALAELQPFEPGLSK